MNQQPTTKFIFLPALIVVIFLTGSSCKKTSTEAISGPATNATDNNNRAEQLRVSPYPQNYISFDGSNLDLFAWEGNKVMILSRNKNLNRRTMTKWLNAMDATHRYYKSCIGREPTSFPPTYINNRTTVADVPTTCGAGWL